MYTLHLSINGWTFTIPSTTEYEAGSQVEVTVSPIVNDEMQDPTDVWPAEVVSCLEVDR